MIREMLDQVFIRYRTLFVALILFVYTLTEFFEPMSNWEIFGFYLLGFVWGFTLVSDEIQEACMNVRYTWRA